MKFLNPINSKVVTNTAPMTIDSTTKVDNLNADLLDGLHSSSFESAIVKSASAPGSPTDNMLWIDTTTSPNMLKRYNLGSTTWINVGVIDHAALANIGNNSHANIDTALTKLQNNIDITKDPTGFTNNDAITITYNSTNRTITLNGTFEGYYRGVKVTALVDGWTSPAHPATLDKSYYLYYDGSSFYFGETIWTFDKLHIAYVQYNTNDKMAIRETHGFMGYLDHQTFHATIGAYRVSGGNLTAASYVLNSTTPTNRRPLVDTTVIADEDLKSTVTALTTASYTQRYLVGSGATRTFTKAAAEIIPVNGSIPYWNQNNAGTWQQTPMANNDYGAIFLVAVPTTNDAGSLAYRYMWTQPQIISDKLSIIESLETSSLVHGEVNSLVSEFVFIGKIIIQVVANDWRIISTELLTGTRNSQVGSPSGSYLTVVSTDGTLIGSGNSLDLLGVATPLTAQNVGNLINGATNKANPVDIDYLPLMDSAAGNITKKLSWSNIRATLKTYFDTIYSLTGHGHSIANITSLQTALDGKVDDSQVLTNVPAGALFTDTTNLEVYDTDPINPDIGQMWIGVI